MKHAGSTALKKVAWLLDALRALPQLTERTPGAFYRKSSAFLHFHDDLAGVFVDVKIDPATFTRFRVSTKTEQRATLARVTRVLNQGLPNPSG